MHFTKADQKKKNKGKIGEVLDLIDKYKRLKSNLILF
jgi:hypothetical protein